MGAPVRVDRAFLSFAAMGHPDRLCRQSLEVGGFSFSTHCHCSTRYKRKGWGGQFDAPVCQGAITFLVLSFGPRPSGPWALEALFPPGARFAVDDHPVVLVLLPHHEGVCGRFDALRANFDPPFFSKPFAYISAGEYQEVPHAEEPVQYEKCDRIHRRNLTSPSGAATQPSFLAKNITDFWADLWLALCYGWEVKRIETLGFLSSFFLYGLKPARQWVSPIVIWLHFLFIAGTEKSAALSFQSFGVGGFALGHASILLHPFVRTEV